MPAPTHRARAGLVERLRELRASTGLTGADFAEHLGTGWGQSKVSRIETGRRLPSSTDVEAWAAATGADAQELLGLLSRAKSEYATFRELYADAGGAHLLQDVIGESESAARVIAQYQPVLVLGILQTADYAREMLHLQTGPADTGGASEDEIAHMIASRLRRQALLYEPGREVTLLMGEGALHTRVASPATMRAQLGHIAHLAETLTTATIGIVPFAAPAPVAVLNGWTVQDDLVTVETDGGDLEIADPEEVERYQRRTRLMLDAAVTGAAAARLCRQIADEEQP